MKKLIPVLMLLTIGCASKQITIEKKERFRKLTETIDRNNPQEVKLAQTLYVEIMND